MTDPPPPGHRRAGDPPPKPKNVLPTDDELFFTDARDQLAKLRAAEKVGPGDRPIGWVGEWTPSKWDGPEFASTDPRHKPGPK